MIVPVWANVLFIVVIVGGVASTTWILSHLGGSHSAARGVR